MDDPSVVAASESWAHYLRPNDDWKNIVKRVKELLSGEEAKPGTSVQEDFAIEIVNSVNPASIDISAIETAIVMTCANALQARLKDLTQSVAATVNNLYNEGYALEEEDGDESSDEEPPEDGSQMDESLSEEEDESEPSSEEDLSDEVFVV